MGVKGFQKGHLVSDETRAKISKKWHKEHDNPELIGEKANG